MGFDIISSIVSGIVSPITSTLSAIVNKKQDVDLEKFKVNGQVDMSLVQAHTQLGLARIGLLKDKWLIATQVFFAAPLGIYYWKCIVWDKVLAWGVTDKLGGDVQLWSGIIIGYLFATNVLDRWTRKT